ncbi:hypothetical protein BDP27DRAFT_1330123, partial [Rhodocollybia butyracea]
MNLVSVSRKNPCLRHGLRFSASRYVSTQRSHGSRSNLKLATTETDFEKLSPEDQIKQIRATEIYGAKRGIDIWANPIDALDVAIPYATSPWSKSKFSSLGERLSQWLSNQLNKGKNFVCMANLLSEPGTLGSTSSIWAIAEDKQKIPVLTQPPYLNEATKLSGKPTMTYIWTFHREVSPTKIISMRAVTAHFGTTPPPSGSRLAINALVKFETEQSLEIYDQQGKALHTPEPNTRKKGRRIPAKKQQLTEYYIFEKRMYTDTPWQIKERIFPKAGMEPAL